MQIQGFELQLAADGKLSAADQAAAGSYSRISKCEIAPLLASLCGRWSALATFLHIHPLGKKLGIILALSEQGSLLFSDHDVLAFNAPTEWLSFAEKDVPCYIMEEREGNCDPAITERAREHGVDYIAKFNSVLLYIPKGSLSIDLAAQLLAM